jgi:diaminopimelate decarboxylase
MDKINNFDIREIVERFGTPIYVYDETSIVSNYQRLNKAFAQYFERFSIHYSVKANSNIRILQIFNRLGAGVDTSSPFELRLALHAGFNREKVVYTGNYESIEDLTEVVRHNIRVNLDDISSFSKLLKISKPDIVSFRVNPGIGKGGFEGITTGGADAKFGVPYELLVEAYKMAKMGGIRRFGVHIMTGSNILEPYYFAEILEKLFRIIGHVFNELEIQPEYIDIGGGLGIPYTEEEKELDLDFTAKLVSEVFFEYIKKYGFNVPELILEPGRYLVGNAGYLIAKVTGVKNGYKKFVGIDAGMNCLIRPALYGATHRISVYGKNNYYQLVNICGQICENSDIIAKNLPAPEIQEGDILIIRDAGAYGFSMSSNYNGRPRPAEILVNQQGLHLIRRREGYEDFISTMILE